MKKHTIPKHDTTNETFEFARYLPDELRTHLEKNYYEKVSGQALFEEIREDENFLNDPTTHVALYTDHGVVHARDVSKQIIKILDNVNGKLIHKRGTRRLEFLRGYGVMVAYFHDIGMKNFSSFGRFMHPEYAAQKVFTEEFDHFIDLLWNENYANVAWRLLNLSTTGELTQEPYSVLREMLSLSICHSKSKIPIEIFNNPEKLRERIQLVLSADLTCLFHKQKIEKTEKKLNNAGLKNLSEDEVNTLIKKLENHRNEEKAYYETTREAERSNQNLKRYYKDFENESFQWFLSGCSGVKELYYDVIDTLRILRAADALRQRGTVLKTSGGYEVFISQDSANAIYALRNLDNTKLYLLEADVPINAGEANLASSEIDKDCNLRVSFHRGEFSNAEAVQKAASNAAIVITDITKDVINSFVGNRYDDCSLEKPFYTAEDIIILAEGTDDNPLFAEKVTSEFILLNPEMKNRMKAVASLQNADMDEVERYLAGKEFDWDDTQILSLLKKLHNAGHRTEHILPEKAFKDVKIIYVNKGDLLLKGNTPSAFVYIPLGKGLQVFRMGGYLTVSSPAYVPMGSTGVIRGSIRNADVVSKKDIELLMIPKEIYLRHWHKTYSTDEFRKSLKNN